MDQSANIGVVGQLDSFGDELSPGTVLCGGQYTIESYLNSGGFGITYLARDSLGRKIVIKECFPGAICCRTRSTVRLRSKGSAPEFSKILDLFEKEARALSELQHPYIVGVHQIFKDNDTAYMALDFVDGRDLLHVIEAEPGRLTPKEIKELLIKVLDAVAYMHDRDILHRDISPDNILLEPDNSPVLIDFGAARESATRVSRVLSKVLTVKDGYSPQELYLAGSEQAFSSDLYALAATFYHLVSGQAPPSSQVRLAAVAKNLKDPLEPLTPVKIRGYDSFFLDAINRCLSIFPNERLQNAAEWRDLDEGDRISAIEEHHKRAGIHSGNATVHAGIDAAVETQLAEGMPVTVETLDRLLAEGVTRPDAIHLLAAAISHEMFAMLKEQRLFDVDLYGKRLRGLRADTHGGGNGS